jgi:hypothetical protein
LSLTGLEPRIFRIGVGRATTATLKNQNQNKQQKKTTTADTHNSMTKPHMTALYVADLFLFYFFHFCFIILLFLLHSCSYSLHFEGRALLPCGEKVDCYELSAPQRYCKLTSQAASEVEKEEKKNFCK